jgi:hypothetical protein
VTDEVVADGRTVDDWWHEQGVVDDPVVAADESATADEFAAEEFAPEDFAAEESTAAESAAEESAAARALREWVVKPLPAYSTAEDAYTPAAPSYTPPAPPAFAHAVEQAPVRYWNSVQLSPPGARETFAPVIPASAPAPVSAPRRRVVEGVRLAAAMAAVAVLAMVAVRAATGALDLSAFVPKARDDLAVIAPDSAPLTDSLTRALLLAPSTASGRNASGALARTTGRRARRESAAPRGERSEGGAALPAAPRVEMKLDTRTIDDSVRSNAEAVVRSTSLAPIARPDGTLPAMDGRRPPR